MPIRYPAPLRPAGSTVAVTAPSAGVPAVLHPRLDLALAHLRSMGFTVVEGACLREVTKHQSAPRDVRAAEFMKFWLDPTVDLIFPPWGGEFALHLLPLLDWPALRAAPPKWLLGYSDTSTLGFALAVSADVATAHGPALMETVPGQPALMYAWRDLLALPPGASTLQISSPGWPSPGADWAAHPAATLTPDNPTRWRAIVNGREVDTVELTGRAIGGCLDVLVNLVGTPYADLPAYARRSDQPLLLYLENCEATPETVCRNLWQLRLAGWFDRCAGIVLGRNAAKDTGSHGYTYPDAIADALYDLDIPLILDADLGHRPPQATFLNGAPTRIRTTAGKGQIEIRRDA